MRKSPATLALAWLSAIVLSPLTMILSTASCSSSDNSPPTSTTPDAGSDQAFDNTAPSDSASDTATIDSAKPDAPPSDSATTTVKPTEIDDILVNPGLGFAEFGSSLPESEYPAGSVVYRRWTWADLEPTEGQYNFAIVDKAIEHAKEKGGALAFRIMPVYDNSSPQWLLDKGVASVTTSEGLFPDHNNPTFLQYHHKLVEAFGKRYAGSLDIDHVDIGSVGCWGEWNTACCSEADKATCDSYFPTEQNQQAITDEYFEAFPGTPLVALIGAPSYAESKGAGWRGDCFGDYGYFSSTWNHMEDLYDPASKDPIIGEAWKHGPVQFESCGVMQEWLDKGFDIDLILQKGLEWHVSVFNNKSRPVPQAWRPKVDEWLKHVGYRIVLVELTHNTSAKPSEAISLKSSWQNKGVAPTYHPWPIAWRLRATTDSVAVQGQSSADLRNWLPGPQSIEDSLVVPSNTPAGTYSLDVAILTEDSSKAHVKIAIQGVRSDLWYPVSQISIKQ